MKMLFGGVIENSFNDSLYMEIGFLYKFKIEKVFFVNGIVFFFVMESQYFNRYNVMNESRFVYIFES